MQRFQFGVSLKLRLPEKQPDGNDDVKMIGELSSAAASTTVSVQQAPQTDVNEAKVWRGECQGWNFSQKVWPKALQRAACNKSKQLRLLDHKIFTCEGPTNKGMVSLQSGMRVDPSDILSYS